MAQVRLAEAAAALPEAWRSTVLARIGGASLKVLRMDESPFPEEVHDYPEALLVLEGEMRLQLGERVVTVGAGEVYVVEPGVVHAVAPGSEGVLVIVDA